MYMCSYVCSNRKHFLILQLFFCLSFLVFQSCLRPISLSRPDLRVVAEMQLCACGFTHWKDIAGQLSSFLSSAELWMSACPATSPSFGAETVCRAVQLAREIFEENLQNEDSIQLNATERSKVKLVQVQCCLLLLVAYTYTWIGFFTRTNPRHALSSTGLFLCSRNLRPKFSLVQSSEW